MPSRLATVIVLSLVLLQTLNLTQAGNGYHYDRPAQSIAGITQTISNAGGGGHHFGPLPTVAPLPPVPALPPLPTGRPGSHVQTQSLVQVHPPPSAQQTASKSIANAYRPPSAAVPQYQHSYLPPAQAPQSNYQRPSLPAFANPPPSAPGGYVPTITLRSAEVAPEPQTTPGIFGQRIPQRPSPFAPSSFAPTAPASPYVPTQSQFPAGFSQAPPQPLRIPFGKQAVVHLPQTNPAIGEVYNVGDRQVKQYAVIEIIDNDIEQDTRPFLSAPIIDPYRAQVGASGTGAAAPPVGQQINSRANALVFAQQNLAQQRGAASNDAIALGSGGLGFVRLPNGNVYLGSGSLGYISGQQHSALIQEARTRTGAPMPDALHFGHGALGTPSNGRRFRF